VAAVLASKELNRLMQRARSKALKLQAGRNAVETAAESLRDLRCCAPEFETTAWLGW
jgi:hypothetical protein